MDSQEITQDWLHETRKEIDVLIQKVKKAAESRPAKGGAEITLSYRALQQGKMWLGQALGELGSELPQQFADKAEPNDGNSSQAA
jgi:hypothetical protein